MSNRYTDPEHLVRQYKTQDHLSARIQTHQRYSQPPPVRLNLHAQTLPIADRVVDTLLANHILFHVAAKDRTSAEFARLPIAVDIAAWPGSIDFKQEPVIKVHKLTGFFICRP